MFLYFFLLKHVFFSEFMRPALARSQRRRSFAPCLDLCRLLLAENSGIPQDAVLRAILDGLPYHRTFWQGLVGECLVHGAHEIPRMPTTPTTLCCLLAPDRHGNTETPRWQYAPIQQVHFGTLDLLFGSGYYRPDHAGLNDRDDVCRLAGYLQAVDPSTWAPRHLEALADCTDDDQRAEELAYVRDWWPSLVELYQNAKDHNLVVVCERV
jgi:hypothetical protein